MIEGRYSVSHGDQMKNIGHGSELKIVCLHFLIVSLIEGKTLARLEQEVKLHERYLSKVALVW